MSGVDQQETPQVRSTEGAPQTVTCGVQVASQRSAIKASDPLDGCPTSKSNKPTVFASQFKKESHISLNYLPNLEPRRIYDEKQLLIFFSLYLMLKILTSYPEQSEREGKRPCEICTVSLSCCNIITHHHLSLVAEEGASP